MNIQVRVIGAAARSQLKAMQAQLASMNAGMNGNTAATGRNTAATAANVAARSRFVATGAAAIGSMAKFNSVLHSGFQAMNKWGNQVQWTGRQLQRNWTLPLALAAGAAVKFNLDQEKSFIHTRKVYGDIAAAQTFFIKQSHGTMSATEANTKATKVFNDELSALDKAFEAISEHYGIALTEINNISGAWAAAGVSGAALAQSVNLTAKAIILGNMDAMTATKALISTQAQFNLNTQELTDTLFTLNAVENQTGIELGGLIEGFQRSAGVARASGVGVRELAAELAALVPTAGTAAQAGNALKTIYSRLLAPTKDTSDILKAMGINLGDVAWKSANLSDRLKMVAVRFNQMSSAQKANAASIIGSRWQFNKLIILADEMTKKNGFYAKALSATTDESKIFQQAQQELNAVLDSSPNKLQRIWVAIQNGMANAIGPLLPVIISLFDGIRRGVEAFQKLKPETQKFIIFAGLALALLPVLIVYTGSFVVLVAAIGRVFTSIMPALWFFIGGIRALTSAMLLMPFKFLITALWGFISAFSAGAIALVRATGLFALAGKALFAIWKSTWVALRAIQAVMIAQMAAMQAAFAIYEVSLWGKFKAVFLVLHRGIAAGMLIIWSAAYNSLLTMGAARALLFMGLWKKLGVGLFMIWRSTWVALRAIQAVFMASMATLSLAYAVGEVTLWGRLRGALVLIQVGLGRALMIIWAATLNSMLIFTKKNMVLLIGVFRKAAIWIVRAVLGPWGLVAAAVLGIIYALRNKLANAWNSIVSYFSDSSNKMAQFVIKAWDSLPQGVANALTAVARIVQKVAMQIYEWFSYINPFAHHSPSLVENVTNGMGVVLKQFSRLGGIGAHIKGAYADIKAFGAAIASLLKGAHSFEEAQNRAKIKKFAPGALDEYIQLSVRLTQLNRDMAALEARIAKQQAVVDRWQKSLDAANAALDRQQKKLERLSDVADKWRDKLDAAQAALDNFANAPIEGMQAMNELIFQNEMDQKRLRLEMMQMEDVVGPLDDIKAKMDAINGAQELLRGEQSSLRSAGAGSDILAGYQDQIDALEQQKVAYEDAVGPLQDMQAQLDALQRQAEEMDLTKSLEFDPLTHQIELATQAMQELPFDDIMAGITASQADIATYTQQWNDATAAVEAQQAVVDNLTKNRDQIQAQLDKEQAKLDKLKDTYDKLNDAIQAIESSLNDVVSAADKMAQAMDAAKGGKDLSPAMQAFNDAKGGNFPDVGGSGMDIRSNWESQVKDIDALTSQLEQSTADMFSGLNPFTPIKAKFKEFMGWAKARWADFQAGFSDFFDHIFGGSQMDGAKTGFEKFRDSAFGVFKKVGHAVMALWHLFGPEAKKTFHNVIDVIKKAWNEIGPEVKKFVKLVWPIIKVIIGILLLVAKTLWSMLNGAFKPVFYGIINIIKGAFQVINGILEVIIGLFTLDFPMALHGLKDIFVGTFNAIWGVIEGVFGGIIGAVKGFVEGIWNFFVWLWDELVGHSIVPDMIDGIFKCFQLLLALPKWIWNHVLKPIYDFFVSLWTKYVKPALGFWWQGIKNIWNSLTSLGRWVWDNVLKPVVDFFKSLWADHVKPALGYWWQGIKNIWSGLTGLGKWVWDNVLKPIWDKFGDILDNIKGMGSKFFNAGKSLFENMIDGIKSAAGTIADLANAIWDKLKTVIDTFVLDPIRSALNFTIDPPGPMGPWHFNLGDKIPHLYEGGIIKGSREGTMIVAGDRGHDEAIVPLSGPNALRSGTIGSQDGGDVTYNFYGDLEFPNVKTGDDAEAFLKNLEILAEA